MTHNLAALVLSASLFSGQAAAEEIKAQLAEKLNKAAETHFRSGLDFYRAGEMRPARVEFQAAYELSKLPDLLHNLSMVAQLEGNITDAIALEERYIAEAGANLSEGEADQARGRVVRLRALLAQPTVTANPAPTPPQPTSPTNVHRDWRRPLGIGLTAGGGAALLASLGVGIGTSLTVARLNSGELTYTEAQDAAMRATSLRTTAIVLGITGGVLVAAGLPILLVRRR